MNWFINYRFKGLTIIFISIILTILLSKYNFFNEILFDLRHIPFVGSFIAGILYISASTALLGILMLSDLSTTIHPIEIAIIAGLGATIGDYAIFKFFRKSLLSEITIIYNRFGGQHLTKIMRHKHLRWSLPIVGAIIIASPFPDEIGVSLMGITKIKSHQFLLLSLVLNITGVFLLVSAYLAFKSL